MIPKVTCITKEAVTYLVAQSKTETGHKLRDFIYFEVLPEIEKTGGYNLNESVNNQIEQLTNIVNALVTRNAYLENKIEEILDSQKYLISLTKFNIPNKYFSFTECCDYLNNNFPSPLGKIVPNSLKEFLREIGMLKSNYKPYVKYIKDNKIILIGNPYSPVNNNIQLSKAGLEDVITQLRVRKFIN